MNAKHTPGPWEAHGCEVRAGSRIVARTAWRGTNWSEEELAQREADAKLIATLGPLGGPPRAVQRERTMDEAKERKAFEAWLVARYPGTSVVRSTGGYAHTATHRALPMTYASVQMLWEAWRARAMGEQS